MLRSAALLAAAALLLGGPQPSAAGIYPEDHWEYSTKLTTATFNSWITGQAPAWNAIVKEFATDSDVSFGDVVLREDRIIQGPDGGELKPGRGGWPTVRYFNQATGYDGAAYEKKTTKAMCDELGDVDTMRQAVETAKAALAAQKAEL